MALMGVDFLHFSIAHVMSKHDQAVYAKLGGRHKPLPTQIMLKIYTRSGCCLQLWWM